VVVVMVVVTALVERSRRDGPVRRGRRRRGPHARRDGALCRVARPGLRGGHRERRRQHDGAEDGGAGDAANAPQRGIA
jgi:hypothetical protein